MAELLIEQNMVPLYLIFSTISPREEAIARLTRAGWTFLVGHLAADFMHELIGMDIQTILTAKDVREEVALEMARIMRTMYESYAVRHTLSRYPISP